ncbi:hypothetical protein GCM10022255_050090 [Dactylosporangium darangshiense]|uniref:Uncharacterized protein n=1 Tax=Dactylosporangium darangshiense TaxID=579108 RepID=A0ABP8DCG2_9ACTN
MTPVDDPLPPGTDIPMWRRSWGGSPCVPLIPLIRGAWSTVVTERAFHVLYVLHKLVSAGDEQEAHAQARLRCSYSDESEIDAPGDSDPR